MRYRVHIGALAVLAFACTSRADVIPDNGPLDGGNSVVVTNAGTLGDGSDITNVLVGGLSVAIAGQGADWVAFTAPASATSGVVDVVIQSTSVGDTTLVGSYTYNTRGRIFGPGRRNPAIAGGVYHTVALKQNGSVVCWGLNDNQQCQVPEPNADFVAVSAGWRHSVGMKSDGSVVCWGDDSFGQCSVPDTNTRFVAISAGEFHNLGLTTNGSIVCWGWTNFGLANVPGSNADFVAVDGGGSHSAALKSNGTVVCWGDNTLGQCNVPAPNTNFVSVAAAWHHTVALRADGSTVSWGDVTNNPAPNADIVQIGAGDTGNIGLKSDGSAVVWGWPGDTPFGNSNVVAVAAGALHDIVLKSDGSLVCWGITNNGQCAIVPPNAEFGERGGVVPAGGSVTGGYPIAIHGTNLCASSDCTNVTLAGIAVSSIVDQNPSQIVVIAGTAGFSVTGDVRVFSASRGQSIRLNAFAYTAAGMDVLGLTGTPIASGENPSVAKGTMMWAPQGGSVTHQLTITNANAAALAIASCTTNGSQADVFSITGVPQVVEGNSVSNFWIRYQPFTPGVHTSAFIFVNDSDASPYAVNVRGSAYDVSTNVGPFAGGNTLIVTNVDLGNGADVTNVSVGGVTAVVTGQGSNWVSFAIPSALLPRTVDIVIQSASLGLAALEGAYRYNPAGRIFGPGCGDYAVAAGTNHSVVLRADSSVACWGANSNGQCNVPAPNTNFTAVAASFNHTVGLKRDGSVICWGNNTNGQCDVPAPNTNFIAIAAGPAYSMGLKAGGTIVYWGSMSSLARNLPVVNTNFVSIAAGDNHGVALQSDGSVVCWGANGNGQRNAPENNSNFVAVAAGSTFSRGLKADGGVVNWGQLSAPVVSNAVFIDAGGQQTVAVLSSGGLSCGKASAALFSLCDFAGVPFGVVRAAAGGLHGVALGPDGTVTCWGGNVQGQCNVPVPNANYGEGQGASPAGGLLPGGFPVTITGTNLCAGDCTNVTLAGIQVSSIVSQSATQIVVVAGDSGGNTLGDVRVFSTQFGEAIRSNAFAYYFGYSVAVSNGPNGQVFPSGAVMIAYGAGTSFIAQAAAYYHIDDMITNGVSITAAQGRASYTSVWPNVTLSGTVYAAFAADVTSNQVPHWWMAGYGITSGFEAASTSDLDGDTQVTVEEFVAGTDPTNASVYFKVGDLDDGVLSWASESGRVYSVCSGADFTSGVWSVMASNIAATPPENQYVLPALTNESGAIVIRVRLDN